MILSAFAALTLAAAPAEGLEPPFQELLAAAAAEDDEAVFTNAIHLLSLTQSAERIAVGAARLSDHHAIIARRTLGLPVGPVTPVPPPAMIAVDAELQEAAVENELVRVVKGKHGVRDGGRECWWPERWVGELSQSSCVAGGQAR